MLFKRFFELAAREIAQSDREFHEMSKRNERIIAETKQRMRAKREEFEKRRRSFNDYFRPL